MLPIYNKHQLKVEIYTENLKRLVAKVYVKPILARQNDARKMFLERTENDVAIRTNQSEL